MDQRKSEMLENFIREWATFSDANPEIVLGEWLHTFSIMMGLSMRLSDLPDEHLDEALFRIEKMIRSSYENAKFNFKPSSLQ